MLDPTRSELSSRPLLLGTLKVHGTETKPVASPLDPQKQRAQGSFLGGHLGGPV